MGNTRWSKEENKLLAIACERAGTDANLFVEELRKGGLPRALSSVYTRLGPETAPRTMADGLRKNLYTLTRNFDGTLKPEAQELLSPGPVVLPPKEPKAEEPTFPVVFTIPPPAPARLGDKEILNHIAYSVLGQQLGRMSKDEAYDDIVKTLQAQGVVR